MKHPHREEWIPYLFGEADPSTRKRLMELAGRYDALAGNPSRVSRMIERPLPLPRVVPGYGQSGEA